LHQFFRSKSFQKRETNIMAVLGFEITFERDSFCINPFGTFREMTFKQVRNLSLGALC